MRNAIVALGLLLCNVSWAQQGGFINLGKIGDYQVYVGAGNYANRVGGAVLVYVHEIGGSFASSAQVLASCDASWISDVIRFNFSAAESPVELEAAARDKAATFPLDSMNFTDWQQSQWTFVPALKPYIKTLCKAAASEPRNVAIPVANYGEDGKQPAGAISILTGSVVRKGPVIDAWLRTTHYRLELTMVADKPLVLDGVEQKHKVATGTYAMRRTSFDCSNRQASTYQSIEYNKDGGTTNQWSIPREKLEYSAVVPNSVGEGQLEAICRIYGGA